MASRRYYSSARGATTAALMDQHAKRRSQITRARQIRDAMQVAQVAFQPGGFNRNTPRAMLTEKKVVDINELNINIDSTGTQLQLLNGCVPGSQNYNRIGRKICMKSLQLRGHIAKQNNAAAANAAKGRLIIVYDKQPNGTAPTFANIIQSQNIAGATSSLVDDMVNLDNRDRFEIIRDMVVAVGPYDHTATTSLAGGPCLVTMDTYIKLGNRETVYNAGTAGTIGDIATGSLYAFWIASADNNLTWQGGFRLRFSDL